MKTSIAILFVLFLTNLYSFGQKKFAYYQNNKLYISSLEGEVSFLGSDIKIKKNKKIETSSYYTYSVMPKEILDAMPIADGMVFYSALQSLPENNTWLFVERSMEKSAYNICMFDLEKKTKNIIFSQDSSPDLNFAFKPFAWSKSKDIVYLEALIFGSATENEGIWSYNITTKQFSKLSISPSYLSTPVISPDKEHFIYGGTADTSKDLDSPSNIVFVYNIVNNQEKIVVKDNNSRFSIFGWIEDNLESSDLININEDESYLEKKKSLKSETQESFKLPWSNGIPFCVTTGTYPAPPGSIGSSIVCATFNPHTYIAIDFANGAGGNDPVLASAAGTIFFAGINGSLTSGYGNLVKIKHSDGTITYYAHLKSISVNEGDFVQQGCRIGIEGTTGGSTGDHIHFEWRDNSDNRFTNAWPTFGECGCTPHQNYQYISNNIEGSCGVTPPSNDNCIAAFPLTPSTACNYQSFSTYGATQSIPATSPCNGFYNGNADDDVWFKFSATAGQEYTVNLLNGSSFDGVLDLRSGACNGTSVNCDDQTGSTGILNSVTVTPYSNQTYYIRVYNYGIGSGTGGGNFQICVTVTSASLPDLKITNGTQTANPTNVSAGSNVLVACSEDNIGNAISGSNYVTIWLSSNSTLDEGTDIKLGQISFGPIAAQSCSVVLNTTVQIPSNTNSGSYYLFFWADGNKTVNESDDDNNYASTQITITNSTSCTTPGIPNSCMGSATGQTSANLSWSAGSPAGSSTITYYWVVGTSSSVTYGNGVAQGTTASTSASTSTLSPGTTYYLRVYAKTSCDETFSGYRTSSSFTTSASCITPGIPVSVNGNATGQTTANLSWSQGSPAGSPTVTYYWVVGTSSTVTYGNGVAQSTTSGTSASISGLSSGITYYLRVYANTSCNSTSSGYGTSSAFTTTTSCVTPGIPVSINGAVTGQTTANLSWSQGSPAGSSTITYYWVVGTSSSVTYGNGVAQGTTTSTSASTSNLSPGTTYYLRVYAKTSCDETFSGYRTSSSFTTSTSCSVPSAPTSCLASLGAFANGDYHCIELNSAIVQGVDGYAWEQSLNGTTWVLFGKDIGSTSFRTTVGDSPNIPLYYRVNVYKCSPEQFSNYTYASPQPIYSACDDPSVPTSNNATSNSINVTLNVETPVPNPSITTYSIYCTTTSQYVQTNGTLGNNEVFQTMSSWSTKTVTGLSNNKEYCFYAKARNNDGDVRYNSLNIACGTTLSVSCSTPGSPINVNGSATGQTTANLSWSAGNPVGGATVTYYWVVGTSSSVTYGNGVAQGTTTGTSVSTSALSPGTTYYLRVYANTSCNNTNSGYGPSSSFLTSSSCITPGTPVNVSGSTTGQTTANLSWSAGNPVGSAVVKYYWLVGTSSSVVLGNGVDQGNITGTSVSTSALSPGTTYYLRVFSITSCNESGSDWGTSLAFTTSPSCTTPGSPINVSGSAMGQTTANLSWLAGNPVGSPTVTYYWVVGTSSSVTYGNGVAQGSSTGTSTSTSTLSPGTTYYLRVYAKTSCDEAFSGYRTSSSFTTPPVVIVPTLTTTVPIANSATTAMSGGNITSDGGAIVIEKGVCWSTSANPTVALNTKTTDGTGNGSFTSSITGLTAGATYHVRAYATNSAGIGYGSDIPYTNNITGIDNNQIDEILVFPNPVSGMLNIEYNNDNFKTINILNSQGGLLLKEKVITPKQQVDFSKYESGLYILEFVKTTGEIKRVKVIKH